MANDQHTDLIEAIRRDHREVEQMLGAVTAVSGDARRQAFDELATKLKAHEKAEQEIVHPLAAAEGGADEAKVLKAEESAAAKSLAKMAGLDVDSAEFERMFDKLRADVLAHAQEEEHEEHPRLQNQTPAEELERRGEMFEAAERRASSG